MKGDALLLSRVIAGGRVQFIIPVYQRNYSWLTENCNQLFNDLVDLVHSGRPTHFFGSIVTSPADGYGINRLVIDGQQRLTTVSLLLLAGIHAVEDGKLEGDKGSIEEAKEEFLMAKFSGTERKIKLLPIENDMEAYDRIFEHDVDNYVKDSKMTRNYQYFYERLTKEPHQLSFDALLNAIEHLAGKLKDAGYIADVDSYIDDIYLRESQGQTGIGHYVAIPHGKSDSVTQVGIAIGKVQDEIEWETLDGKGVKLIFLFAVGNDNSKVNHAAADGGSLGKIVQPPTVIMVGFIEGIENPCELGNHQQPDAQVGHDVHRL